MRRDLVVRHRSSLEIEEGSGSTNLAPRMIKKIIHHHRSQVTIDSLIESIIYQKKESHGEMCLE
ncbi:unnamed protein product [Rhodiola kirilowii]